TLLLFFLGNVEKELANADAVARQIALEAADVVKAFLPDVFCDELGRQLLLLQEIAVHPHDEGLLIVAAIENADAAALRQVFHAAPQVIGAEVLAGRRLKGKNLTALRVDAGHDMLDRAVLPGRIHRLKDQQYRPTILSIKPILQLGEQRDPRRERFLRSRF